LSDDKRVTLERLRKIIRAAVPKAKECISYQLPVFRLDGKCFVWFGAAANHCAIYGVVGDHKDELKDKDYDISKGTIRVVDLVPYFAPALSDGWDPFSQRPSLKSPPVAWPAARRSWRCRSF
jgi:Domain of unknown function (DU1801)